MKTIKTYCPECDKETVHIIWTEDAYGASGVARIFSTLLSVGMSNLACTTYSKCISCGNNKKIPLYNNSSSLYDILDWLREKKFLHVEIQWYPHGWMFVIYKIDSQEDEPYDTFSEVYTSYLDCLEAGIIRALNII